jgi:hypothetical protein
VDDTVPTVNVKVAVPPGARAMLVLLKVMVSPVGEDESVRATVPLNPLRLETVAVATNEKPCAMLKLVGLVVIEKSGPGVPWTKTETWTVWNVVPLIPAMDATYVPEEVARGTEIVIIDIAVWPPARVTAAGLTLTTRFPVTTVVFKLTVPVKLLMLETLRVDVAEEPALTVRALGLAARTKSRVEVVEKTAVLTVSGTEARAPFAIVTHVVVPDTLLEEQPVWYSRVVPDVFAVTL